ncbi:transcription initiation factor TFIID subunit 5-like isoform X2 [Musa acuminata AAA Group]|uniref:transcription initiation factor TFIID subunit 5-like isoform X2 n=1 Tax=Musa acuminata AAA Group TaxID=214697 RepID=UPI0031DAFED8
MEEEEIQKAVAAYLRKKGFTNTELALQEEQNRVSFSSNSDHSVSRLENGPVRYSDGYSKLRLWAYSSLDLYKHELLRVLFPVYIHCFMDLVAGGHVHEARNFFHTFREDHESMHLRDLQKLEGILSPLHLEEIELSRSFRQNKFKIKMCEYSYDLLLQYLQKTQSFTMRGVINEHIDFEVSPGQPTSSSGDADFVTIEGRNNDLVRQINQKEIHWGVLEDSLEQHLERPVSDSEKAESANKEVNPEDNKKRPLDGGKQGIPVKMVKKDKLVNMVGKNVRSETSAVSVAPRVKPELTLPTTLVEVEQAILEDLRSRVQLNSLALPSISFYTFVNTCNRLNCSSISQDGSLVAGGFSDSSLKVWDISKIGQFVKTFYQVLFILHILNIALCLASVRLWSTKLNTNLVCYKGHNYPVWDVQFSPVGHYFASSSHDRTARIWSMERIQPLRIMAGHLSDVDCVQWHANCNYIATGSSDKTVRLWDVQSGECVRIFIGHRSMILSLAMSPDGRYMASGDEDGTIMMWDLSSGRCVSPLVGHSSCVWTLAFSCEGTLLASGSADCTIKLWDVTNSTRASRMESKSSSSNRLRLLKALPTKSTPVYTLQFSRRNLLFAAGALSKCS